MLYSQKEHVAKSVKWPTLSQEASKLASKAKAPVVPIVIDGTYKVFEQKRKVSKGETVRVTILPAIDTASLDRKSLAALPNQIEETIKERLAADAN